MAKTYKNSNYKLILSVILIFSYYLFVYFFLQQKIENKLLFFLVAFIQVFIPLLIIFLIMFKSIKDIISKKDFSVLTIKIFLIIIFILSVTFFMVFMVYMRNIDLYKNKKISTSGYREISEVINETINYMIEKKQKINMKELTDYFFSISGINNIELTNRKGDILFNISKNEFLEKERIMKLEQIFIKNFDYVGFRDYNNNSDLVGFDYRIYTLKDEYSYYITIVFQPIGQIEFREKIVDELTKETLLYIITIISLNLLGLVIIYYIIKEYKIKMANLGAILINTDFDNYDYQYINQNDIVGIFDSIKKFINKSKIKLRYLIDGEKRKIWDEFSKRINHEFKNPLTPIRLSSERLLLKFGKNDFEETLKKSVDTILSQVTVIEQKLNNLSIFYDLPSMNFIETNFEIIMNKIHNRITSQNIPVQLKITDNLSNKKIFADINTLEFVFFNILELILNFLSEKNIINKTIFISLSNINYNEKNYMQIVIKNENSSLDFDDSFINIVEIDNEKNRYIISFIKKIIDDHNGFFANYFNENGILFALLLPQ